MMKIILLGTFILLNWFQPLISMLEKPKITVSFTIDNNTDRNFVLRDKTIKLRIPAKKLATKVTIPITRYDLSSTHIMGNESLTLTDTTLNKDFRLSLRSVSSKPTETSDTVTSYFQFSLSPGEELKAATPDYPTSDFPQEIDYKVHLALAGDNLEHSTIDITGSLR